MTAPTKMPRNTSTQITSRRSTGSPDAALSPSAFRCSARRTSLASALALLAMMSLSLSSTACERHLQGHQGTQSIQSNQASGQR